MSDRLTITRNYNLTPDEGTTLLADGIAEAGNLAAFRFFVNDFSTCMQGLDLVATWTPPAIGGRTTFSGIFNYTDTDLTEFQPGALRRGPRHVAAQAAGWWRDRCLDRCRSTGPNGSRTKGVATTFASRRYRIP